MARSGKEYISGLRDNREVWLGGRKLGDVTTEPAFQGALRSMAGLFDLQHEEADAMLVPNPDSDEPMNASHLIPRSREDLDRRHKVFERTAEYSVGMLGRTPDYVNLTFAGFAGRADLWATNGNKRGAENLRRYQKMIASQDLALTHTIVHPTIDRSLGDVEGINGEVALRKVRQTAHGIVVRGARVLATLGPFADHIAVYPGQPLPRDATPYALGFAVPLATPGLKIICRDSYELPTCGFDHPFSSRFDEQDAFVIFDDVEVPQELVFIDGDTEIYNKVMTAGWLANIMQQTTIRSVVKFEFAYELLSRMVACMHADSPANNQMLGEVWTYAQLVRAGLRAAEADARDYGNGVWFCNEQPFHALRPTIPGWMARVNEIVKVIGGHNLLATPTRADLDNPELQPLLDRYIPGADGSTAAERARLFRAAWDFVGSALGSRTELYERYYLASAPRMYQVAHQVAQREHEWDRFPRFTERMA